MRRLVTTFPLQRAPALCPRSRSFAFTLVELLTVVAVVGILAAILLPTLSAVRKQARKAAEISAARQLITAYHAHAADHRGRLMPGSANGREQVLEPVRNLKGQRLPDYVGKRFPWRLVPYLNRSVDGCILVNESIDASKGWPDYDYNVSLLPSLGINASFIGTAAAYVNNKGEILGVNANAVHAVRRFEQARAPERLIVFASSNSVESGRLTQGYWELSPPSAWPAIPENTPESPIFGAVHLRWGRKAVVAHLDSSVKLLDETALRDMRRWSNAAEIAGDPNWSSH